MTHWILWIALGCTGGEIKGTDTESDGETEPESSETETDDGDCIDEVDDGQDNDCDGLVDEDFLSAGDVIVSEFLAVAAEGGEWLELYNASARDIDLVGFTLENGSGDSVDFEDSFVLESGAYAVVTSDDDGEVTTIDDPDVLYDAVAFSLGDAGDTITLSAGTLELSSLTYESYVWPIYSGYSANLDVEFLDGDSAADAEFWCYSSEIVLENYVRGTPGLANERCSTVDHDGDGLSEDEGDCDDEDSDISPEAEELDDGIDNNCNGAIDEDAIADVAGSYLEGTNTLGYARGLSVGDVDDDGEDELLVGSAYEGSYYAGAVWVLAADEYADWAGDIAEHDDAVVEGEGSYHEIGSMGPVMADNSGDGVADLLIGAYNYSDSYCAGCPQAVLMHGGTGISGKLASSDAEVQFGGVSGSINRVMGHADFTGDGVADVVIADPTTDTSTGTVWIFDATGLSGDVPMDEADAILAGDSTYQYTGGALGGGDVNGDGYDDLLVGAAGYYSSSSALYLVYGSELGLGNRSLPTEHDVEFVNSDTYEYVGLGENVPLADMDGDGQLDVLVAAPGAGEVHAFLDGEFAGSSYDTTDSDWQLTAEGISDYFGYALAAGDLDGDGATDLLVGAPDYSSAYSASYYADDQGLAMAFSGTVLEGDATLDDASWVLSGSAVAELTGLSVLLHDLDGDGDDDSLIAAPGAADGAGRIWVIPSE